MFQEENAFSEQILRTEIYIDSSDVVDPDCCMAFRMALDDLKNGRLAIGAGSGHGLGFCYEAAGARR